MAVIATNTWYKEESDTRFGLALKTIEEAVKNELKIVVVDGGSPAEICQVMRERGAEVFSQEKKGFGFGLRQSLREASCLAGADGVIIRMEAEKHTMIAELPALVSLMENENIDLLRLGRKNQNGYPLIQQVTERCSSVLCQALTGFSWDFCFGPFLARRKLMKFFCEEFEKDHEGHQDRWAGCIDVPQLRIMATGSFNVAYREVDYQHPPEQMEETGREFVAKRLQQTYEHVNSYLVETGKFANFFPVKNSSIF